MESSVQTDVVGQEAAKSMRSRRAEPSQGLSVSGALLNSQCATYWRLVKFQRQLHIVYR